MPQCIIVRGPRNRQMILMTWQTKMLVKNETLSQTLRVILIN